MAHARLLLVARRSAHLRPYRSLLASERDIQIVGDAVNLRETFNKTEEIDPDLVLVSSELAAEPEFEAIVKLFAALDTRWLEFVPDGLAVRTARPAARTADLFRLSLVDGPEAALSRIRAVLSSPRKRRAASPQTQAAPPDRAPGQKLVLIGSSTGGVEALMTILSHYPADCPPTAIVQHTGQEFGQSLARLLDRNCRAEVALVEDGLPLQAGRVVLAAGTAAHMQLDGGGRTLVRLRPGPPVSGHCPSVDVLFASALVHASRAVGVLLTGMGRDGAKGLLELRQAGATTLAQDEDSSLVYGMPKAAWTSGAAMAQLHINDLGPGILRLARDETKIKRRAV